MVEPEELLNPVCKLCGATPTLRDTKQLYLRLQGLQGEIERHFNAKKGNWGNNAVGLVGRYLKEGLHERALTRNIEWGVPLPDSAKRKFELSDEEFARKKIYCWYEAVLGYQAACKEFCDGTGRNWQEFLLCAPHSLRAGGERAPLDLQKKAEGALSVGEPVHYYVHAKDNVPFHGIILPGLLVAGSACEGRNGKGDVAGHIWHLPDFIVSSEYVTLGEDKMSKSKGNLITAEDICAKYDPDMVRYYFLRLVNYRKDIRFSFDDFNALINAELVNGWGNLVNRTLSFVKSKMGGIVSGNKKPNANVLKQITETFAKTGEHIEAGRAAKGLAQIVELINFGNKHFDACEPWKSVKTDLAKCKIDIAEVVLVIANIARLLTPFVPFASEKVISWLKLPEPAWEAIKSIGDIEIPEIEILFKRLDSVDMK